MDNLDGMFPNMDHKTGIHYGVIHQNEISSFAIDDIITNGDDTIYEDAKNDFEQKLRDAIAGVLEDEYIREPEELAKDVDLDNLIDEWNQAYQNDNANYVYEENTDDGVIKLEMGTDSGDIFVIKSPFFTYCKACSPCAPNAGYLTDSVTKEEFENDPRNKGGICSIYTGFKKAYCLPDDWFENGKAPYEYFKVDINETS